MRNEFDANLHLSNNTSMPKTNKMLAKTEINTFYLEITDYCFAFVLIHKTFESNFELLYFSSSEAAIANE